MNEEIDEGDFYHQDFTTASEWEIFIARMEEIIHEWKIQDTKSEDETIGIIKNDWNVKSEKVQFADVEFTLSLCRKLDTLENEEQIDENNEIKPFLNVYNSKYDFLPFNGRDIRSNECSVEYWYGLHHFIILATSHNNAINNESQIKLLLSSVNIVISNSGCEIPIFVQIREKWQRCFQGVYENNGIRTNFEMVHLRKGPHNCKYLTGLLDLFKTKIASPSPINSVLVSVQLSYHLTNWMNNVWTQDVDNVSDINLISKLRFGVNYEPITELALNTTWLQLPEHLVVDSENYSDFDSMQAPKWSVEISMAENPICLLSECLQEFYSLLLINSSAEDLLGDLVATNVSDSANPLDVLTESRIPTISSVIKKAADQTKRKISRTNAPITEEMLVTILYFLFPDAVDDSKTPYSNQKNNKENISSGSFGSENESSSDIENMCKGMKTCPVDSLVWRLSIILAQAMIELGGVKTVAYVWHEFVQEMRYRWEKCIPIPGIASGFPDHRTCLLHQKLQMLNCCIERKKKRESARHSTGSSTSEEDSEDEFFDCDAEDENVTKRKHSLWNKPVGRLSKHGNLRLLETGDQMYIPITQEPVPKTEDQLEEDTDVLLKLGSDAQGSELRARMMSASLLSDMESFKAANPDAVLEDFIRWYSPRDWIEEDELDQWGQKKGHLSSRMLISDNTWVEMWQSAKPVPANRQKRLFDDTREAEKVLHFLSSRTPSHIAAVLLPVLMQTAIHRISEEGDQIINILPENPVIMRHFVKSLERLSRDVNLPVRKYETLIQEITTRELLIAQINSLLYKFNPSGSANERVNEFIANLVTGKEVDVEGQAQSFIGSRLIHMFSEAQKAAKMITDLTDGESQPQNLQTQKSVFPQATKREFVMRVAAARPAPYSAQTDQMLRAIFAKNEFRLCGAFTEDITFT